MQYFVLTNLKKTPLPLRDQTPNYTRKHVSRGVYLAMQNHHMYQFENIYIRLTGESCLNRLDLPLESSPMFSRGIALSCTCMYRLKNIYTCKVYRFCKLAHTKHIVSKKNVILCKVRKPIELIFVEKKYNIFAN